MRATFSFLVVTILTILLLSPGTDQSSAGTIAFQKTRDGCLLHDDFDDGVMDTSSSILDLCPWRPLYADSSLDFREVNGYFQVYGNTGDTPLGQHRGMDTNFLVYNNWEPASLETLELVSVVDMWNLDPLTPAVNQNGAPAIARIAHHYCSNCNGSGGDFNATVSIGYLLGQGTGPGWDPPGPKWGFRVKWDEWANRYLVAMDSLFGDEQDGFYTTMVDNWGFDAWDSTLATGYVRHQGVWHEIGSRKLNMLTCRKTELKSMCKWARNHDIDYRWDNFRLFLHSRKWPVRFQLVDTDSIPLTGDYVLEASRCDTGEPVDRDTLAGSEFIIFLDHTELVIPQTLCVRLFEDFSDTAAVGLLVAHGVEGCYPDDRYTIYYDSSGTSTGIRETGAADSFTPLLGPALPNPTSRETWITYTIPGDARFSPVTIHIHDVSGRIVRCLAREHVISGVHRVLWNGEDDYGRSVGSGVYFARMAAGSYVAAEKVIVLH